MFDASGQNYHGDMRTNKLPGMPPVENCQCPDCRRARDMNKMTPAEFAAEALGAARGMVGSAESYKQRLADEQTMADTVAVASSNEVTQLNRMIDTLEGENERLKKDNAVLVKRIEQLETSLKAWQDTAADIAVAKRYAPPELIDRIADTLRTFYNAPLTLSALQPIIALAMELNEDIVERKR